MLTKLLDYLSPKYNSLTNTSVFGILFLITFFIRLPFFFRDYIDRDESTFILMGQSWVNGHLPYMELWDLKPPLNFLFFASSIFVFGKSMLAIRLFGVIAVVLTAFFTYKITLLISTKKVGFWVALFAVSLQSLFGSMQGVMSEHISMLFFIPALYLLLRYDKWYWLLFAGLLMGLTSMVKLNMAYPIALAGIYHLYTAVRLKEYKKAMTNTVLYGFGIIVVIVLTILPYYFNNSLELWWNSVIKAPLVYSETKRSSILNFVPIVGFVLLFLGFTWKMKLLNFQNHVIQLLAITIVGVLLSFIKGGRINGHYLIQLYPILLILVGIAVNQFKPLMRLTFKPIIALVLLFMPIESYLEYGAIIKNKITKGTFYNGEGFEVPNYLMTHKIDYTNILFTEYHIGYWLLSVDPPTKAATHPSNLSRSELFPYSGNPRKTTLEEITYILEVKQPAIIVKRKGKELLDRKLIAENNYVNHYLAENYTLLNTIGEAVIYQRLK